jgi:hypothetical protein
MLSPKRVNLLLAAILAGLSMVFVIATYSIADVNAESKVSGPTLKSKILRRKDRLDSKLDAAEVAALRKAAKPQEERVFEDKIPQHLPIKIKIRAEKEKAAKDLDNPRWHRDLEIEVKNTGDKPIYYLSLILEMPEIKVGQGFLTLGVRYGQHTLFDGSKGRATPQDVPLEPKETLILRLDDGQARGWDIWRAREKASQPKKILMLFEELNFGDGTGFFGDNGAPWPFPKPARPLAEVLIPPRNNKTDFKSHHATTSPIGATAWSSLPGGASASLWPASFPLTKWMNLLTTSSYQPGFVPPDNCCPTGCRLVSPMDEQFCYYCPVVRRASAVQCIYEEDGICLTVYTTAGSVQMAIPAPSTVLPLVVSFHPARRQRLTRPHRHPHQLQQHHRAIPLPNRITRTVFATRRLT